jgi:hypothetical protein
VTIDIEPSVSSSADEVLESAYKLGLKDSRPTGGTYARVWRTDNNGQLIIETNAQTEYEFLQAMNSSLIKALAAREGDEEYALSWLLPAMVDIACKLRGYKAESVVETRVLVGGKADPRDRFEPVA